MMSQGRNGKAEIEETRQAKSWLRWDLSIATYLN